MSRASDDLPQSFGLATGTFVVLASMVGMGILTTSGYTVKAVGSHQIALALWALGGLVALCGALSVAEIAAAIPKTGGEYVYLREAYGPLVAFVSGWTSFVAGFSAPTALAATAAATYLVGPWTPDDPSLSTLITRVIATIATLAFAAVHLRGQRQGSSAQAVTTLGKIIVLLAFVVGGLAWGHGDLGRLADGTTLKDCIQGAAAQLGLSGGVGDSAATQSAHADSVNVSGLLAPMAVSLIFIMYSYTGWNAATYIAGEVKDAPRVLPRCLLYGCGLVTALYLAMNVTYAYALPVATIQNLPEDQLPAIAKVAAQHMFGPWVWGPLSVAIGLGLLATVSAFLLTGPRVYYAMARDGLFPAAAGRLHPAHRVPATAIMAQTGCTLVLLWSGTFEDTLTFAGVGLAAFSAVVVAAVIVLRVRQPELPRPFKTWGYPVTPLVYLAVTIWMVVWIFQDPEQRGSAMVGVGSILAGVPLYFLWQRFRSKPR